MGPNDIASLAVTWRHEQLNIWAIFTSSVIALVCLFVDFVNVEGYVNQCDSLFKQERKQQYPSCPDTCIALQINLRDSML